MAGINFIEDEQYKPKLKFRNNMKVNDEDLNSAKIIELELTIKNLHTLIFYKDKEIESLNNSLKKYNPVKFLCQSKIEINDKCDTQCEHCFKYFGLLEQQI